MARNKMLERQIDSKFLRWTQKYTVNPTKSRISKENDRVIVRVDLAPGTF